MLSILMDFLKTWAFQGISRHVFQTSELSSDIIIHQSHIRSTCNSPFHWRVSTSHPLYHDRSSLMFPCVDCKYFTIHTSRHMQFHPFHHWWWYMHLWIKPGHEIKSFAPHANIPTITCIRQYYTLPVTTTTTIVTTTRYYHDNNNEKTHRR